jgi:ABC-type nitrate/sulfonate/bicarbonate transport system permease component
MNAATARSDIAPKLLGLTSLAAFLAVMEAVIRLGWLNRYIVPPPSEILGSFYRIVTEEHVARRFLFTTAECFAAGVMITIFGVGLGVVLQRYELLRRACETWVAALAAAPVVLA